MTFGRCTESSKTYLDKAVSGEQILGKPPKNLVAWYLIFASLLTKQ